MKDELGEINACIYCYSIILETDVLIRSDESKDGLIVCEACYRQAYEIAYL